MAVSKEELQRLFARIDTLKVGILGDFCLDVYWNADMRLSELSRETPHFPLPIVQERMQPGGAGNVACNLAALQPKSVVAYTVVGEDWRGASLLGLLQQASVDTHRMITSASRVTNAYIKPLRQGISDIVYEDPRLDFENHHAMNEQAEDALLQALAEDIENLDLLYVCDQMQYGNVTERIREWLCQVGATGKLVVVDSRDRIANYKNVLAKPNDLELCRALRVPEAKDLTSLAACATHLETLTQHPLVVTLGERGCMVMAQGNATHIPACPVEPPIDICGAGDTFGSVLSLLHCAGAPLSDAAIYATHASAITVKQIFQTGVVSRQELIKQTLLVCSQAVNVEPLPPKGSSTTQPVNDELTFE